MQLIKIRPDSVQIKSDTDQLGNLHINDALEILDERENISLVCVVTGITKNEEEEHFDFEGNILEPESTSVIDCGIIGSLYDGKFSKSVDVYPSTNVKVGKVSRETFSQMIQDPDGVEFLLGSYATYGCPAGLDGNKFFQRHAAILGNTGSGKSCAVATILERVKDLRGANLVIFDVHGEYAGLSYASTVKIGNDGMNFPVWFLSLKDLYGNLLKIKEDSAQVQVAALRDAFYKARRSDASEEIPLSYDIRELCSLLEAENALEIETGEYYKTGDKTGMPKTVKGELNGKLTSLIQLLQDKMRDSRYKFMFSPKGENYLTFFLEKVLGTGAGSVKVIDLSSVPNDMLPTVVAVTARLLYRAQLTQTKENVIPLTIVCDEAHNYIPAGGINLTASQRRLLDVFETIAKEGRKFGVSLLVVSQRPSELNRTILAQCANYIVLKLSNDIDKQMIQGILPEGSKGIMDSVNLFRPGDCLVVGDGAPITFKVKIDLPQEMPDSRTVNTWDEWKRERKPDIAATAAKMLEDMN
ncbi:ATP-binding protein [Evtepia gabavorous]|uniref:ATP-binding protein n=1 Tax=Evtepia gabavorous TaxID=2211183 RepID=UPI003A3F9BF7